MQKGKGLCWKRWTGLLMGTVLFMSGITGVSFMAGAAESFRISTAFGNGMVLQQKQDITVFGFGQSGKTVTVTLQKDKGEAITGEGKIAQDGTWSVKLPAQNASFDEYTLTAQDGTTTKKLSGILIGEVWVTGGQSNMMLTVKESVEGDTWHRKRRNGNIRLYVQSNYTTPYTALNEPSGIWQSAAKWEVVEKYSAIAYYFAETLYRDLQVPIGVIDTSVGGTPIWAWISQETMDTSAKMQKWLKENDMYQTKDSWQVIDGRFTYAKYRGGMYNSRVAALKGLRAAGILWYQGEDQVPDPTPLEIGIPLLVDNWSQVFGDGKNLLPFISIQLAPYNFYEKGSLPKTNEVMNQAVLEVNKISGKALSIPIYDVSLYSKPDNHPIHPATKQPVGERSALAALGMVYNRISIYSGPIPTSAVASGDKITITFKDVGTGLSTLKGTDLMGFKLVKKSGVTEFTDARIASKNTLIIECDSAASYTGVQYAFDAMNNTANLCNKEGFVALPFRIDIQQGSQSTTSIESKTSGQNTATKSSDRATTTDIPVTSEDVDDSDSTVPTQGLVSSTDSTDNINAVTDNEKEQKADAPSVVWLFLAIGGVIVLGSVIALWLLKKKKGIL